MDTNRTFIADGRSGEEVSAVSFSFRLWRHSLKLGECKIYSDGIHLISWMGST